MDNYRQVILGVILIAGLYNCLVILVWQATTGLPNAIDNDDGLPRIFDLLLFISIILVDLMTLIVAKSIIDWRPKLKSNKSKWNSTAGSIPGPPATKRVDWS